MEPAYLVTSFQRSGSSMMMRCLEAGGLPASYDSSQEILNICWGKEGYKPNPNGFYGTSIAGDTDFPSFYEDHRGKVTKFPKLDLKNLVRGRYKVLFMVRSPKEIIASMRKFTPYSGWGLVEGAVHLYDVIKPAFVRMLSHRGDCEILEVKYEDVVNNPVKEFTKIRDFGFPINIQAAASMVDPTLHRLKLETL